MTINFNNVGNSAFCEKIMVVIRDADSVESEYVSIFTLNEKFIFFVVFGPKLRLKE